MDRLKSYLLEGVHTSNAVVISLSLDCSAAESGCWSSPMWADIDSMTVSSIVFGWDSPSTSSSTSSFESADLNWVKMSQMVLFWYNCWELSMSWTPLSIY